MAPAAAHTQDFIVGDDVTAAILLFLYTNVIGIFNVCSSQPVSMLDLAETVKQNSPNPIKIVFPGNLTARKITGLILTTAKHSSALDGSLLFPAAGCTELVQLFTTMIIGVFQTHMESETGFQMPGLSPQQSRKIFFLGDACGYFPFSNRIIEALRDNNVCFFKGNHDAMLLGELDYPSSSEHIYQVKRSGEEADASSFYF